MMLLSISLCQGGGWPRHRWERLGQGGSGLGRGFWKKEIGMEGGIRVDKS